VPNQSASLDSLLKALADPTRRAVVERLALGPAAMSELARPFDMALPSFLQHLKVLEASGLVDSQKTGRVRTYRLKTEALAPVETWLSRQRRLWETRLDQFDAYIVNLKGIQKDA